MKSYNLTNRNAPTEVSALSVTGFDGPYRVDSILTYLHSRLQPCYLSVDLAVSIRVAVPCKMISEKTENRPFKMRGEWIIYNVCGHIRSGFANQCHKDSRISKLVNGFSVPPKTTAIRNIVYWCPKGI